jgi:hypothetical protein
MQDDNDVLVLKGNSDKAGLKPHRHKNEHFTWMAHAWDVSKLWGKIDSGQFTEKAGHFESMDLDRGFIEAYATQILCLKMVEEPGPKRVSLLMAVDTDHARALPKEALTEPLLLLKLNDKGGGIMRLGEDKEACHVLGDGNHRLARAFFDGVQSLKAYALTEAASREVLIRGPLMNRAVRAKRAAAPKKPKADKALAA